MRHVVKSIELASRGTLTATVPGQSLYKAPQTYLAQHPTAPPEEQVITTDPENVLLRVLKLSQKREGPKGKGDKGKAAEKSKRYALLDGLIDSPLELLLWLSLHCVLAKQASSRGSRGCTCQQKAKLASSSWRSAHSDAIIVNARNCAIPGHRVHDLSSVFYNDGLLLLRWRGWQ